VKRMASELNVLAVVLAQLNREMKRDSRKPEDWDILQCSTCAGGCPANLADLGRVRIDNLALYLREIQVK
jgi:heterodisulfide reductase subunit C